ncbi:3-dehydroquinate dehydratase [Verminephrobacter aporrectodeae subsp. tuberculatae]|nr:3-dehydroquinate dehydratase [Verminephrobacter aporrectodeae subsp. tuberculatae]MCW8197021.1 3-dehydroquinate dehydratase [Verminephrobacter aporrectodeae subsp. tuberculatae]MCW8201529.1 3-dehydroquinate dehydratase [Verminephrobacter aporrectodeae subsp. tuberculatae]MCW8205723.1 3-dehydroquinate dehydratase [Verminephrobacter aporrectodeae subsp. tuberculatae]
MQAVCPNRQRELLLSSVHRIIPPLARQGGRRSVPECLFVKTVFVLNGPNLNLLGQREPAVYGMHTLADVEKLCSAACARHGFALRFHQSNHEGALLDWIHEAGRVHAAGDLAGVVMNAGAYTHTSVALHDAIKGTGVTLIELHISNVHARESFRQHSCMAAAARAVMCGFGVPGYGLAIDGLAQLQPAA